MFTQKKIKRPLRSLGQRRPTFHSRNILKKDIQNFDSYLTSAISAIGRCLLECIMPDIEKQEFKAIATYIFRKATWDRRHKHLDFSIPKNAFRQVLRIVQTNPAKVQFQENFYDAVAGVFAFKCYNSVKNCFLSKIQSSHEDFLIIYGDSARQQEAWENRRIDGIASQHFIDGANDCAKILFMRTPKIIVYTLSRISGISILRLTSVKRCARKSLRANKKDIMAILEEEFSKVAHEADKLAWNYLTYDQLYKKHPDGNYISPFDMPDNNDALSVNSLDRSDLSEVVPDEDPDKTEIVDMVASKIIPKPQPNPDIEERMLLTFGTTSPFGANMNPRNVESVAGSNPDRSFGVSGYSGQEDSSGRIFLDDLSLSSLNSLPSVDL